MSVAAVDIGTNSVRLLITDDSGTELTRLMQITRLGQGVDERGVLAPDAIARTLAVLETYRTQLTRHDAKQVRVTATSAARDAQDSEVFFTAVEQILGHRPELLSGDEEAALSFRGATEGLSTRFSPPFLVIDIGGGSTEFVLGSSGPEKLVSVDMGCVRMTERHLHRDPPAPDELAACIAEVTKIVEAHVVNAVSVEKAQTVVGLAGTVTTLAHLKLGLTHYDAARSHHSRLTRDEVHELFARLCAQDLAGRRRMLAEPGRADVIVGGAAVLCTLMDALAIPWLLVSETDILDGLASTLRAPRHRGR